MTHYSVQQPLALVAADPTREPEEQSLHGEEEAPPRERVQLLVRCCLQLDYGSRPGRCRHTGHAVCHAGLPLYEHECYGCLWLSLLYGYVCPPCDISVVYYTSVMVCRLLSMYLDSNLSRVKLYGIITYCK